MKQYVTGRHISIDSMCMWPFIVRKRLEGAVCGEHVSPVYLRSVAETHILISCHLF